MPVATSRFLEPATLGRIKDLRLVARSVVEGFLTGLHLDPRPGAGVEFSQYRSYQSGDDLRSVDWRVYARSDRYFVRESDVEKDVSVRFVLDATASMSQEDDGQSKFDYARFLVASLAYLVSRQGDRIAFHALQGGDSIELAPRPRHRVLMHLLHTLECLEPSGAWPSWDRLRGRLRPTRGRELLVVVSDLHERNGEILRSLSSLKSSVGEVLLLHLLGRGELDFPFTGDVVFEDLESGKTVRGNAESMRASYLDRLGHDLETWRQRMLQRGISYELVRTDLPLDTALRSFLVRRRRLP